MIAEQPSLKEQKELEGTEEKVSPFSLLTANKEATFLAFKKWVDKNERSIYW